MITNVRSALRSRRGHIAVLLSAGLTIIGGKPAARESDRAGLSLYGLNYTDVPISDFYVNGTWGGNVSPYAAGLSTAGSIGLPGRWHPGIKVTIQWSDDRLYAIDKKALMTAEVEIPKNGKLYGEFLLVAFLPGRKVKAYASGLGPGHVNAPDGLPPPR